MREIPRIIQVLEKDFGSELYPPRAPGRLNRSKSWSSEKDVRQIEVGVVEEIECFGADLKTCPLG